MAGGSWLGALLLALAFKHFLADFVLQTRWMARGKEAAVGWPAPLLAHSAVHAAGTLLVALAFAPALWWLGPVDLVVHGAIDRAKSLVGQSTHLSVADDHFWWLLGFDQFLHQITNIAYALMILAAVS